LILDTFQSEGLATARSGSLGAVMHAQIKVAPNGPNRPLTESSIRCSAARHSGLSLQVQNNSDRELVVCGQSGFYDQLGQ
jgi:hypothetical protein